MSQETIASFNRLLEEKNERVKRLPMGRSVKYALLSDFHLGNGRGADNFRHNEDVAVCALGHYREGGFTLILNGDIEEFYQFSLMQIARRYRCSVYSALKAFAKNRIWRVYGNHDAEWGMVDPIFQGGASRKDAYEGIMLGEHVLVTHGHQGETKADRGMWFSRFWVRLYAAIEPFWRRIFPGNKAATTSPIPDGRERTYYDWAKENRLILVCGHVHVARFVAQSIKELLEMKVRMEKEKARSAPGGPEDIRTYQMKLKKARKLKSSFWIPKVTLDLQRLPCYFNTGGATFNSGLTAIEIEGAAIRMVLWENAVNHREVLVEGDLNVILNKIRGTVDERYIE